MTRHSGSRETLAPAFKHVWKDVFQSERGPTQPTDRAVLFCLYANMDLDGGNCFPSIRLIAEWLGRNKDTVNAATTRLKEAGWLQVRVLPGRRGKRHQYFPMIPSGASQWLGQIKEVCPSEQAIRPSGSDAICPSGSDLLVHELVHVLEEKSTAPSGAGSPEGSPKRSLTTPELSERSWSEWMERWAIASAQTARVVAALIVSIPLMLRWAGSRAITRMMSLVIFGLGCGLMAVAWTAQIDPSAAAEPTLGAWIGVLSLGALLLGLVPLAVAGLLDTRGTAEWFIAIRYLMAKRRQTFISIITGICVAGIATGVWLIITVLSVMNGFERT